MTHCSLAECFLLLAPLYVVCRRGNDSQIAVGLIRASLAKILPTCLVSVKDLIGGLRSWSDSVDNSFPKY